MFSICLGSWFKNRKYFKPAINKLECNGCFEELIDRALTIIIKARKGLIDKDDALDALWEYLINIEYEVRVRYINGGFQKMLSEG